MATRKKASEDDYREGSFEEAHLQGQVTLEGVEGVPEELKLTAYVLNQRGKLLGMAEIDPQGEYLVIIKMDINLPMVLVVAPQAHLETVLRSAVHRLPLDRGQFGEKPPFTL